MTKRSSYVPGTASIDMTAPDAIARLIEFHRATFGDARMDGSGADGADAAAAGAAAGAAAAAATGATGADAGKVGEHGFPEKTPVAEMTAEQQAAYWKHQARKHEDRAARAADYDAVVAERDRLKAATQTETERAIEAAKAEAAATARAEARKETLPALVRAEFKAAAAGRIPGDKLGAILEPLDLTKFLSADGGQVDTDKVQQYVDGIAPAGGSTWPDMGQGRRGSTGKATGVSAGRSLYEERHPAKKQ